jgi:pyridinium-3,5-bisthiocarboxylic acid mononucleotide nickel chelatase
LFFRSKLKKKNQLILTIINSSFLNGIMFGSESCITFLPFTLIMKILYYDCFAGISGDMNMAAMVDLGVPLEFINGELKKIHIENYRLEVSQKLKQGIFGTQVNVEVLSPEYLQESIQGHSHGHGHNHSNQGAQKEHTGHMHRTYKDIKEIINHSGLNEKVKNTSLKIFKKIAVAEGKIHNKKVNDVHFHEVGAIDSIVDIVGAAICYHYLKPDRVLCSTVELGGGFVNCAHGKFPVPAPATAEILKDIPVKLGTVNVETTTPTGAAILSVLVDEFTDNAALKINKTSYGIGHREMEIPNVLRVHWADFADSNSYEMAVMVECNLDDMSPEHYGYLLEKLFSAGAHDVYMTPIIMKKSRPATKISVLCSTSGSNLIKHILFSESTTLGIRTYNVQKEMLKRKIVKVSTKFGDIDLKVSGDMQENLKAKPEYEQCIQAAKTFNIPLRLVVDEAIRVFKAQNDE